MTYMSIKRCLDVLAKDNEKEFIKAFISYKNNIEDEKILEQLYNTYVNTGYIGI